MNEYVDFGWIMLRREAVIAIEFIEDYNDKGEAVRAHLSGSNANFVTRCPDAIARMKKLAGHKTNQEE